MSIERTIRSFAPQVKDLTGTDRIADRARSVKRTFEHERCPFNAAQLRDERKTEVQRRDSTDGREDFARAARRESFMIKRHKPQPVLKPSLALSLGPDRATFNQQWIDERMAARKKKRSRSR